MPAENRVKDAGVSVFVSVAFFMLGIVIAQMFGLKAPFIVLGFSQEINIVLMTLGVFVFSTLFFGRLTQFFFILVGMSQAGQIMAVPFVVVLNSVPLFIAGFAGTLFGKHLLDDMEGKDNFYEYKMELLKWFGISIAAAILVALVNPVVFSINEMFFRGLGLR